MNFIHCIVYYVCLIVMSIFILKTHSLSKLQPLRREIRYSKFDLHIPNESIGTVLKSYIKNFPDKQTMFMHMKFHKKINYIDLAFSVSKCKEYYVDCVNIEAFDVLDVCSKLNILTLFFNYDNSNQQMINKCPIFGEYYYNNVTFISDKFGSAFSYSKERWWELYWKMHIKFFDMDRNTIAIVTMEFYFLQLRSRNRKH